MSNAVDIMYTIYATMDSIFHSSSGVQIASTANLLVSQQGRHLALQANTYILVNLIVEPNTQQGLEVEMDQ